MPKPQFAVIDDEEEFFDGVAFASTDHGDELCFDFAGKSKGNDYEVHKYDHESDSFEPYARNFAECIKRFAGA